MSSSANSSDYITFTTTTADTSHAGTWYAAAVTSDTTADTSTRPWWTEAIGIAVQREKCSIDIDLWEEQKKELYWYCDRCGFRHNYHEDFCIQCGAS